MAWQIAVRTRGSPIGARFCANTTACTPSAVCDTSLTPRVRVSWRTLSLGTALPVPASRSTSPLSSAASRVEGSGMVRYSTLSSSAAPWFLYSGEAQLRSGLRSSLMTSLASHDTKRNGPVPTGLRPKRSPNFFTASGLCGAVYGSRNDAHSGT